MGEHRTSEPCEVDYDRRQQDTLEQEQDVFNAEMELRRFLWLAEHGNTTVEEVDKVRGCLKTLGVNV